MQFRDYMSSRESAARVFNFIRERLHEFQRTKNSEDLRREGQSTSGPGNRGTATSQAALEGQFRAQIIASFPKLVKIDSMLSFKLVDEFFYKEQVKIIESISGHP